MKNIQNIFALGEMYLSMIASYFKAKKICEIA